MFPDVRVESGNVSGFVFRFSEIIYKYLLTVAGVDIVTLQGNTANPPRWLITRVLFFVMKWLCTDDNEFLCIFFKSFESESKVY